MPAGFNDIRPLCPNENSQVRTAIPKTVKRVGICIKTKTMKKNFFLLALMFLSFATFAQVSSEDLSKNSYFIEYITVSTQMGESLADKFTIDEIKIIAETIENRKKENLSLEQQHEAITKLFKLNDPRESSNYYESIKKNWSYIKENYGTIDQEVFVNAAAIVLDANVVGKAPKCGWKYALCAAGVGVKGALVLASCETSTVGFGTPFCVAATAIVTAEGLMDCKKKYCK